MVWARVWMVRALRLLWSGLLGPVLLGLLGLLMMAAVVVLAAVLAPVFVLVVVPAWCLYRAFRRPPVPGPSGSEPPARQA